ncbi:MOSC N-terminal beta barrel domain-containing protein [Actinoplanes auranticolor]|uniref:MOSC N-terminal beta barrel domain-containing protein n=1 Tax=Actinoplanes auranticolor TaxID=47988 RepID=UPI001FE5B0FC|nr:MOSC N-terminal beta barrel domain-containing protein [Actinoplanes auranticolor]
MKVLEIRRYPIKSLLGERPPVAEVDQRGLAGDRLWAVRDPDGKHRRPAPAAGPDRGGGRSAAVPGEPAHRRARRRLPGGGVAGAGSPHR